MRVRKSKSGVAVRAIAGTHVVILGMNASKTARKELLGFAIHREDKTENEHFWLRGMKTFLEVVPIQLPGEHHSLLEHPAQTFRWADYTAKPGHQYVYTVVPMRGTPKALVQGTGVPVEVATETEGDTSQTHDVYFNRAVAGSQAYARRFGNVKPNKLPTSEQADAYACLSRGLEEAMTAFIGRAKSSNFALRAAVYEFNHEAALMAFKKAKQAGADVQIVYDAKKKGPKAKTVATLEWRTSIWGSSCGCSATTISGR